MALAVLSLTATQDTKILKDSPNSNYGSNTTLEADGNPDIAALLKWDFSAIPAGSTIQAVTLTVNLTDNSDDTYEIYRLKRDWQESQTTWNNFAAGSTNRWQSAGAAGSLDRDATVLGRVTGDTGTRTFSLNTAGVAVVQSWVNNTAANFGFIIQDYDDAINGLDFRSRESSTAASRPRLNVTYVTSSPSLAPIGSKSGNELASLSFTASATDPNLPNDTLSYSLVAGTGIGGTPVPTGATINPTSGAFNWSPSETQDGSYSFKVRVTDSSGQFAEEQISFTIAEVNNHVPVLPAITDKRGTKGLPLSFSIGAATDADMVNGNPPTLSYSVDDLPPGSSFDANTRTFSWTPAAAGVFPVTFKVSDGAHTTTQTINITVALPGDFNGNGVVDAADYVVWRNNGGSQSEYDLWRANFGQSGGVPPTLNVAPSFSKGADQEILEDSGMSAVAGWATGISAGPVNESGQSVSFLVSNDNNSLFATQPAIAADGALSYTLAQNAYGSATVTVRAKDDGGTANGGVDTSAPQTFTISVAPVNDAPSFTKGANQAVQNTVGAVSASGWASAITAGPGNESTQTVSFLVQADNTALFEVQPSISADGTLIFTPATNAVGTATVSVRAKDTGGNANGGQDTSGVQQFTINISSSADAPAISAALLRDTAPGTLTNSDGITFDPTISGAVFGSNAVASLTAAVDNGTPVPVTINSDGTFVFDPPLARNGTADGNHVVKLTARDIAGSIGTFDVTFTLDTQAPVLPLLSVSAASGFVDSRTSNSARVTLLGATEPGVSVQLVETSSIALANNTGGFQFQSVPLVLGDNLFTSVAADAAGNVAQTQTTIKRVETAALLDPVLRWNQAVLDAIRLDASNPTYASRGMAMVHAAIYDAVSAIEGKPGYYITVAAPAGVSLEAAVTGAAHAVLSYLYPAQHSLFDAVKAASLAQVPDGAAETGGLNFGKSIGDAIVALRTSDGWDNFVNYVPTNAPGHWQETEPIYAPALDPQWANLDPFSGTDLHQFAPAGPPPLTSQEWADALNETKTLGRFDSTVRTADQTQIARFWADGAGTSAPPGHWNFVAQQVARDQGNSIAENARLFAMLDIALADAAIVAWQAKYKDDLWRPVTAIRNADTDGNDLTTVDATWSSFLITPNFPEYTSGHSTFSGAAAAVLTSLYGDNYAFTATSQGLPGVTRSFRSFQAAAEEAGRSRIYGGIHYQFSNEDGHEAGDALAQYVLSSFTPASDILAPKVLLSTDAGLVTKTNVQLSGRVIDNLSGVASLTASVDGGTTSPVTFDSLGNFSFVTTFALNGSTDGAHQIQFVATDFQGNISNTAPFNFTLDTRAPTLDIQAPTVGANLSSDSILAGNVDPTGSSIVELKYAFTGQSARTIPFDAQTGNFSVPLDITALAPGATTVTISTRDAAGHTVSVARSLNLAQRAPFTIDKFTPLDGARDVGSTYRPQVFFTRAVNPTSLNANNFYATGPDGSKLAANIVPAGDGSFAWLFFTQPMPGGSQITVHVDGATILAAADGAALDADSDGTPGGQLTFTFSTVSLTPLVGTSLSGKIVEAGPDLKPMTFDDIRVGPDQVMHSPDDVFLTPVAHAKVYIIGLESQFVFTDAAGNFRFDSVPAGDVKLAIDGRTATNAPAGVFFPEMVMDIVLEAGRANTVMGTMGTDAQKVANRDRLEVYLPRLQTSILQNVSGSTPTTITTGTDAAPNITPEQRSRLTLEVQPGSLRDQNGNVVSSGQVGISTVPASLVREMLPPGLLQHTFDITIQSPGITNFATPAPMTFPNLFGALPGSQLNFLSFDHTTGRLVIEGTATVSADGLTVRTDPGTGITHPGWHGLTPEGSPTSPDPPAVQPKRLNQVIPILNGVTDRLAYKDEVWEMSFENGAVENSDGSYMQVKITVDPKYGQPYLDGLRTQTFNLRAGEKIDVSVAIKPEAVKNVLNLKTKDDTVIGVKYTVEVLRVDPGISSITTMIAPETHYLYRYVDAMDGDIEDGYLSFPDAISDGLGGVTRSRLVEYQGDPSAQPMITLPAGSGDYEIGEVLAPNKPKSYVLIFDPKQTDDDIEALPVLTTPASQVVSAPTPLTMIGSGVGKRDIYLNRAGLEEDLATIARNYSNVNRQPQDISLEYILRPGQTVDALSTRFFLIYNGRNTIPFKLDVGAGELYLNLIPLVGGSGFTVVGSEESEVIESGADKGNRKVTQNYRIEFGEQLGPTASKFSISPPINGTYKGKVTYDFNDAGAEISPNEIALIDTPEERTAFATQVISQVVALYSGFSNSVNFHEDYVIGAYSVDWTTTNVKGLFGKAPSASDIFKELGEFLKRRPTLNLPQRNFELAQILSQTAANGVEVYLDSFFAESYQVWDVSLPFVTKALAKTVAHELAHSLGMQHVATQKTISRANEVQVVDTRGLGPDDFFQLNFAGELTDPIPPRATNEQVQAALRNLKAFKNKEAVDVTSTIAGVYTINFVHAATPSKPKPDFRGLNLPALILLGPGMVPQPSSTVTTLVDGHHVIGAEFEIITTTSGGERQSTLTDIMVSGPVDAQTSIQEMVTAAGLKIATRGAWSSTETKAFVSSLLKRLKHEKGNFDALVPDEDEPSADHDTFEIEGQFLTLFTADPGVDEEFVEGEIAFGSGTVASPVVKRFSISNLGTESATIRSVSITRGAAAWSVPAIPVTVLAPGESLTFDVTFRPDSPIDYVGTLSIDSNVPEFGGEFDLTGDGQPPNLPAIGLDFYNNYAGALVGATTSFTGAERPKITNTGTAPLTITEIRVAAGQGSDEWHTTPLAAPITLAPGESTGIGFSFRASKAGLRPGAFEVMSNDPNMPVLRVPVVATGVFTNDQYRTYEGVDLGNDYVVAEGNLSGQNNLPELRTRSDDNGNWELFLPARTGIHVATFDPVSGLIAHGSGYTRTGGTPTELNTGVFQPSYHPDGDGDGLPDDIEFAIGTNPNAIDTDGDGMNDFAELDSGLNPLDDRPAAVGVVSAVATGGTAKDVKLAADFRDLSRTISYVAIGEAGVAIVDVTDFNRPITIAQLDVRGNISNVSIDVDRKLLAAASLNDGVHLIDISNPAKPVLLRTIAHQGTDPVKAVELYDGLVYVGVGSKVRAFDVASGELSAEVTIANPTIQGMTRSGTRLYVTTRNVSTNQNWLQVADITATGLAALGFVSLPATPTVGDPFVVDNVAWIAANDRVITVNVGNPQNLQIITSTQTFESAIINDIDLNGSGLGIAPGASIGLGAVFVLQTPNPQTTNQVFTRFTVPNGATIAETALATVLGSGFAYVADGDAGLQVINYIQYDTTGTPPTVIVDPIVGDIDTTTNGLQLLETSTVTVPARVTDNVQIRSVELLMNGTVVRKELTYPYDLTVVLPRIADVGNQVVLQVRVTDTGSNVTLSSPIVVDLRPDVAAPTVSLLDPPNGSTQPISRRKVSITFSEPLDRSTILPSSFVLRGPGGDVIPVSIDLRQRDTRVDILYPPLAQGDYTFTMHGAAIKDRAGNPLSATDVVSTFSVTAVTRQPTIRWVNDAGGAWNDPNNWRDAATNQARVPTATDDVLIDVPTDALVTISSGTFAVNSLISNERFQLVGGIVNNNYVPGPRLNVTDTIQVNNTFLMNGLNPNSPATLSGAVLRGTDGQGLTLQGYGGLDGAALQTDILINAPLTYLHLNNGLALNGTMTVAAPGFRMFVNGTQTISSGTFVTTGATQSEQLMYVVPQGNSTLTLGQDVNFQAQVLFMNSTDKLSLINYGNITTPTHPTLTFGAFTRTESFTNYGTMTTQARGTISIEDISFRNAPTGRITIVAPQYYGVSQGQFGKGSAQSFINEGTIELTNTSAYVFSRSDGVGQTFVNTGTIINNKSVLELYGSFTSDALLGLRNTGATVIRGQMNNVGRTFTFNNDTTVITLSTGGTIKGGTLVMTGENARLRPAAGTLDGVTINGDVALGGLYVDPVFGGSGIHGGNLTVINGLTLNGTFTVYGSATTLDFNGAQTVTGNGTIQMSVAPGGGSTSYIRAYNGGPVVFDSTLTIRGAAGQSFNSGSAILGNFISYANIVVDANFALNLAGYRSATVPQPFINRGNITLAAGRTLRVSSPFTNEAVITVGGGNLHIDSESLGGATFKNTGTINLTSGTVQLVGGGGERRKLKTSDLGVFNATAGSVILWDGIEIDNSSSTLMVGGTSQWSLQQGATIVGGTIQIASTATFSGGNNAPAPVLKDVTVNGNMAGGSVPLALVGDIDFNGTVAGTNTLQFGHTSYAGVPLNLRGGTIQWGANVSTVTIIGAAGLPSVLLDPDVVLKGRRVDATFTAPLTNRGQIIAEPVTGPLNDADRVFHFTAAPITNEGTLSAVNRGILRINNLAAPNSGIVSAAADSKVEFTGAFAQSAVGTTRVIIGGTANTQFGQVVVTGTATLAGTFDVQFAAGFVPVTGNRFQVLNYGSRTGVFDAIRVTGLANGLIVTPEYNGTNMTLVVSAGGAGASALQYAAPYSSASSIDPAPAMSAGLDQLIADNSKARLLLATTTSNRNVAQSTDFISDDGPENLQSKEPDPSNEFSLTEDHWNGEDHAAIDEAFESLSDILLLASV